MFLNTVRPIQQMCRDAIELGQQGRLDEARVLVDKIRGLRHLIDVTASETSDKNFVSSLSDRDINRLAEMMMDLPETEALLSTIEQWITTSYESFSQEELTSSVEGLNLSIDFLLPTRWTFSRDIAVLAGPFLLDYFHCLVARGQRRFLILDGHKTGLNSIEKLAKDNDFSVLVVDESVPDISSLRSVFGRSRCRASFISPDPTPGEISTFEHVSSLIRVTTIDDATLFWLPRQTSVQFLSSIKSRRHVSSITHHKKRFADKHVIVVSPGPSLANDLVQLKALSKGLVVVAALKAADTLIRAKITPDFLVWQDPRDHSYALPTETASYKVPLILNESCHEIFFNAPFDSHIVFPDPQFVDSKLSELIHEEGSPLVAAPSVTTTACLIALKFGCRSLTLLGSDLSISNGNYVDNVRDAPENDTSEEPRLSCEAIGGGELETLPNYMSFIEGLQELASYYPESALFNSTSSGAFVKGWAHHRLDSHPLLSEFRAPVNSAVFSEMIEPRENIDSLISSALLELNKLLQTTEESAARLSLGLVEVANINGDDEILRSMEADVRNLLRKRDLVTLTHYITQHTLDLEDATLVITSDQESLYLKADYYDAISRGCRRLRNLIADT